MTVKQIIKKIFPDIIDYYRFFRTKYYYEKYKDLKPGSQELACAVMEYWIQTGRERFDIKNPRTFTEKIQWSKVYDDLPIKQLLTDKVAVKEWIKDTIGKEYLIPTLGVYKSFQEIDFSILPDRFVIKMNHGSAMNIIVKSKSKMNLSAIKRKINFWLSSNYAYTSGFQMQYKNIEPLILIEPYLEDSFGELRDYKFLCFNGTPKFCWVDIGRYSKHMRNVYDMNWTLQPWTQEHEIFKGYVPRPDNYEEMISIAKVLCQQFLHVRVDLYNVNGKIYFGEMTFSDGSGYEEILPKEYDMFLGDMWRIR